MILYLRKVRKKRGGDVKVKLTYKPSGDASFRLFKALSLLINEEDILDYLQRSNKISESAGPLIKHTATSQKNT